MKIFLIILFGLVSGILGGMGMGGGTVFIPLLTLVLGLSQQNAQAINLIAFLPMSIASLIIHFKNGLVKWKPAVAISISATITAICSSFLANSISSQNLSFWFGIFLIVVGVADLISYLILQIKKKVKKI